MKALDFSSYDSGVYGGGYNGSYMKKEKVLLREVEYCGECGKSFLSLYPINKCTDHENLEKI